MDIEKRMSLTAFHAGGIKTPSTRTETINPPTCVGLGGKSSNFDGWS